MVRPACGCVGCLCGLASLQHVQQSRKDIGKRTDFANHKGLVTSASSFQVPRREESAGKRIWDELNEKLKDDLGAIYAILGEAHHLFGQACRAYDDGLDDATALLCRASLESAFYVYLTRKWDTKGFIALEIPRTLDGEIRNPEFEELSKAIRKRVVFKGKQIEAMSRIQKDGNFVAHFASRRTEATEKYAKAITRAAERIDLNPKKDERLKAYLKVSADFRFSIDADKALRNLRDTFSILLTLFNSMPKPKPMRNGTKLP